MLTPLAVHLYSFVCGVCRCVGGCKEDAKADKYHNCRVGPECSNRAFKNKEYIKHQVRLPLSVTHPSLSIQHLNRSPFLACCVYAGVP